MAIDPSRLNHIEGRVEHLDSKVAEVATSVASLAAGQASILNQLEKLAPGKPNYTGWLAAVVPVLLGIAGFVTLSISPLEKDGDAQWFAITSAEEELRKGLQELSSHQARLGVLEQRQVYLSKQHDLLMERLIDMSRVDGESEVSRRAIGDYAKELGDRLRVLERDSLRRAEDSR